MIAGFLKHQLVLLFNLLETLTFQVDFCWCRKTYQSHGSYGFRSGMSSSPTYWGGDFKYVLFSTLFGEMIQFDVRIFVIHGLVETTKYSYKDPDMSSRSQDFFPAQSYGPFLGLELKKPSINQENHSLIIEYVAFGPWSNPSRNRFSSRFFSPKSSGRSLRSVYPKMFFWDVMGVSKNHLF